VTDAFKMTLLESSTRFKNDHDVRGEKKGSFVKENIQDREAVRMVEGNKSKEVGWEMRSNRQQSSNRRHRPHSTVKTVLSLTIGSVAVSKAGICCMYCKC
jgi:hypothetical protein